MAALLAFALAFAFGAPRALADTHCAVPVYAAPALEQIDADVRLDFIRNRLRAGAHKARVWTFTWLGVYSAITIANGIGLGLANNQTDVIDWGIGVGSSLVGVLAVGAMPMKVMHDSRWIDRKVAAAPAGGDRCALLAAAEFLLYRDAKDERFGKSPLIHAGNFAFNIGIAVLLLAEFGHYQEAAIHGLVGIAVGELQIATRPTDSVRALRDYRRGFLDGAPHPKTPFGWSVAPILQAHGQFGLSLSITY